MAKSTGRVQRSFHRQTSRLKERFGTSCLRMLTSIKHSPGAQLQGALELKTLALFQRAKGPFSKGYAKLLFGNEII